MMGRDWPRSMRKSDDLGYDALYHSTLRFLNSAAFASYWDALRSHLNVCAHSLVLRRARTDDHGSHCLRPDIALAPEIPADGDGLAPGDEDLTLFTKRRRTA